jgi:hypothetical protein
VNKQKSKPGRQEDAVTRAFIDRKKDRTLKWISRRNANNKDNFMSACIVDANEVWIRGEVDISRRLYRAGKYIRNRSDNLMKHSSSCG